MLNLENLSKTFTIHGLSGKTIEGCRDVSFNVAENGITALSGPSGSGKSSILKCIYRAYLPTSGKIIFDSKTLGKIDLANANEHEIILLRRREIGYCAQFLKVVPRVSAVNVVAEPLMNGTISKSRARTKAMELLQRVKIPEELFDAYPATFSGGEKQRINIARAIIGKPRLLLLDEPTASLDSQLMGLVIELLKELRDQGTSMVMVFHDRSVTQALADQIFEMPFRQ